MDTLEKMKTAAQAGGLVLKKYYGQSLETTQKTIASDFRTKADLEAEDAILEVLEKEFPTYNIHSEEKGNIDKNSEYTFIIDPLDGTNNFVLGIPNFSVSIGLLKDKKIIAAVIYTPLIEHLYTAELGKGSYCNGKKLSVNTESDMSRSTICNNAGYDVHTTAGVATIGKLYAKNVKRVLGNWSPTFDFCMLASGRLEGILNNGLEVHDFAAGKLIAKEAGALITDLSGNPEANDENTSFIASNGTRIHDELVSVMNS